MIAGLASMLGIGSSHTEISDDEASGFGSESEVGPEPTSVKEKQEKKGKTNTKAEEQDEALMVESDNEDEEDEELGDEECVAAKSGTICTNESRIDIL